MAWDPVQQKAAWRAKYPVVEGGGVLATGGNLVFQGRADGVLAAYRATDGKQLWAFDAGTGIMAPPVTYQVDGVQYVSRAGGMGWIRGIVQRSRMGPSEAGLWTDSDVHAGRHCRRSRLPPYGHKDPPPVPAITVSASPQVVHQGELLFNRTVRGCHGSERRGRATARSPLRKQRNAGRIEDIVLGGSRASAGMPSFQKILNAEQVRAIQAYIVSRTRSRQTGRSESAVRAAPMDRRI